MKHAKGGTGLGGTWCDVELDPTRDTDKWNDTECEICLKAGLYTERRLFKDRCTQMFIKKRLSEITYNKDFQDLIDK